MLIFSVEHLTKSYSEKILLDDVSFLLDQKDKVGLIGINGTGKSTLLKIAAGVEQPDSGVVQLPADVRARHGRRHRLRARMGKPGGRAQLEQPHRRRGDLSVRTLLGC